MSAACWGIGRLPVGVGTVLVVTGCFNDMADFFSYWVTKWVMRVRGWVRYPLRILRCASKLARGTPLGS